MSGNHHEIPSGLAKIHFLFAFFYPINFKELSFEEVILLFGFQDVIRDMSDEEFGKHVSALCTKRLEKPKKLVQQNNKYWTEIISSYYNFDRG